ncbi:MAG: hypothetical protein IT204_18370 [Fimbriimonadaceae bacterium]|nr:hypothetical protein [Fimbriimonadaceae bacterium]
MQAIWLALLLMAPEPTWTWPPVTLSPATVRSTAEVVKVDFSPPNGAAGVTLPQRQVSLVTEGDNTVLRLAPTAREAVTVWLAVPAAVRGRYCRLQGRVRSEGSPQLLDLGAVDGTRPPATTYDWARYSVAASSEWSTYNLLRHYPALSDSLAIRVPAGAPAVRLDDLTISVQTRRRDEVAERLAKREGNLLANGGFEAGAVGFRVTAAHRTIAAGEAPLATILRITDSEPAEGKKCAQTFVVDGPVSLTLPPVVLRAGEPYTFSLTARARSRTPGRLALHLGRADGRLAGRKELALPSEWGRVSTTFEVDKLGSPLFLPELQFLPTDAPYAVDLDALCLQAGRDPAYLASEQAVLALDDGLHNQQSLGHLAAAGETVTVKALLTAGGRALQATLSGEVRSHLGSYVRPLEPQQVSVEAGVTVEAPILSEKLPAGWYQVVVRANVGEVVVAGATQSLAVVPKPDPGKPASWQMATRWTTPDGLLRGRTRSATLAGLVAAGISARWFSGTAAQLWAATEPRPGEFQTAALAAMLDASRDAKLGSLLELDPWPPRDLAPDWLARSATRLPDGRLEPSADDWERHVAGIGATVAGRPVAYLLAPAPTGQEAAREAFRTRLERALATTDPAARLLRDNAWRRLPWTVSGPLESDHLEVDESVNESDPWEVEATRVGELLAAAMADQRQLIWPQQVLFPTGYGRGQNAGWTTADLGPRPFVAVWATWRDQLGDRPLLGQVSAGARHLLQYGGDPAVAVVWSEQPADPLPWPLPAPPAVVWATGEQVSLPAGEQGRILPLSRWPLFLRGLDAAQVTQLGEALGSGS